MDAFPIPVTGQNAKSKASDYKDVKEIFGICGPHARFHQVPFRDLFDLVVFILYNYPNRTPEEIGNHLEEIFKEIHSPDMRYFYSDFVFIDRFGRSTLSIIKEAALKVKFNEEQGVNTEEAAFNMSTADTVGLMLLILNYYQDGCPYVM